MSRYVTTDKGLIVPASFAESPGAPTTREIATIGGGRDITRGFVSPLWRLMPQDTVLQLRGAGNYEIYREVLRDDQVKATFSQRQLAVVSKEWQVDPGGNKRIDKAAAAFIKETLANVGFDKATTGMLFGVFYGYASSELLWGRDSRFVTLEGIKVRDRRRFAFDGTGEMRMLTFENPMLGETLPPKKFWYFATGADHDDEPYGLGLAHWLYWPVYFKRGGLKLWLTFLDKFGAPTAKGTYPSSATDGEKSKLLQALDAITSESGVIVPEGMAIELLEAARSGSASYPDLYDRMDRAISKVVVGQVSTTEGTPGRLGSPQVQDDVRSDLIKADADLICESANRSWIRWLVDWNFPGAAYPRVWRQVEESEDINAIAERDKNLFVAGWRRTQESMDEIYGEGYEPSGAPPPVPGQPGAGTIAGPAFAEPGADPLAALIDRLEQESDAATTAMIQRIAGIVEKAGSLQQLQADIEAAFSEADATALAKVMRLAITAAELQGRHDVMRGM